MAAPLRAVATVPLSKVTVASRAGMAVSRVATGDPLRATKGVSTASLYVSGPDCPAAVLRNLLPRAGLREV